MDGYAVQVFAPLTRRRLQVDLFASSWSFLKKKKTRKQKRLFFSSLGACFCSSQAGRCFEALVLDVAGDLCVWCGLICLFSGGTLGILNRGFILPAEVALSPRGRVFCSSLGLVADGFCFFAFFFFTREGRGMSIKATEACSLCLFFWAFRLCYRRSPLGGVLVLRRCFVVCVRACVVMLLVLRLARLFVIYRALPMVRLWSAFFYRCSRIVWG